VTATRPDTAENTAGNPAKRRRFRGLLPDKMLHHREPRWWQEIAITGFCYWIYSEVRNLVPQQETIAMRHGRSVQTLQDELHLNFELSVNHFVARNEWLAQIMNYYYATLHFIVTIAVLVWLYHRHPGRYAATRVVIFATTGTALLGYYLFPLAPPRLMRGDSFIDTVQVHQTWGSMASGNLADMSNQYAAMPSMHIGWAVWCGITIAALARPLWVRALGALYPVVTLIVIVCTANHFWLDAVGGVICLAFGFALSYGWYGRLAYHLPKVPTAPAKRAQQARQPS
jgi:hypothetical protein